MDRTRLDGSQIFSWLLVALALVLLWAILQPFWSALFLAAVLAGVFAGLQRRLARKLGGRAALAAGLLTVLVLLAIVLPLGGIAGVLAKEIAQVIDSVRGSLQEYGVEGLVERLPGPLRMLAARALESVGGGEGGQSWVQVVQSQSGKAATAVTGFLSATSRAVLGAVLMLIAFYFLLIDGHRLVGWLERVTPLPPGRFRSFLSEFRGVSRAVVISTVGTGAVQAAAALVGYLIARVPNAIFFTLVTFFMSFIPSVGAGSVALVVSVVLFIQGRVGWGIFMIAWGVLVVGLIDNVVKPLLIKGGVEMHGAVVFFALLGGLAAFGAVGLIAGPLVVAFFIAISRTYSGAGPRAA
ncbi:MAG: AI-2E family transporter [Myxococcaceae bacterium]|nr:MAG: AI-2E family transporter [Myxococcaceae bacterium]